MMLSPFVAATAAFIGLALLFGLVVGGAVVTDIVNQAIETVPAVDLGATIGAHFGQVQLARCLTGCELLAVGALAGAAKQGQVVVIV